MRGTAGSLQWRDPDARREDNQRDRQQSDGNRSTVRCALPARPTPPKVA